MSTVHRLCPRAEGADMLWNELVRAVRFGVEARRVGIVWSAGMTDMAIVGRRYQP